MRDHNSGILDGLCGPDGPNCPLSILTGTSKRYDQSIRSPYYLSLCFFFVKLTTQPYTTALISSLVFFFDDFQSNKNHFRQCCYSTRQNRFINLK